MTALGSKQAYPPPAQAWRAAIILSVLYTISNVDRQVIGLLLQPIKDDLQVGDTEMGLLGGFAFAIFYTVMGLPIARLADKTSRRAVIFVGVVFWSVATVFCGLARNFTQLFIGRIGVGVGEAALSPASYSLLSDYFPPSKLGRAMSVYVLGAATGFGLAYFAGGALYGYFAGLGSFHIPVVGEIKPWQATFIAVGAPGIALAFLMTLIKEPERRSSCIADVGAHTPTPTQGGALLPFLKGNWKILAMHFAGISGFNIAAYGFNLWLPAHFIREFGWSPAQVGVTFGGYFLILGVASILIAGRLADQVKVGEGRVVSYFRLMALWTLISVPCLASVALVPTAALAMVVLAPCLFLAAGPTVFAPAVLQLIAPNTVRAQVSALYLFVVNIMGIGLGPLLIGLITDFGFGDPAMLKWSISIVCGGGAALAFIFLFAGVRLARRSFQIEDEAGFEGAVAS
ncbi:MFS transporter [Hyphococcus flavus]|uniref:MFS transporter n=1 Tax=Hyphococcus flavus TaxID=1866326 RepID=A0AAE9ZAJ2_9PROT|nr:MFS transporter [Hyphococcus flavus]WDI30136.1 MFS transporter [Hyphococcus flavus]